MRVKNLIRYFFRMPQLVGDADQRNAPEQVRASRRESVTELFFETSSNLAASLFTAQK